MQYRELRELFNGEKFDGEKPAQRKIPFVWKLRANGVDSILIGTDHHCIEFKPEQFIPLLEGKKYLLSEVPVIRRPNKDCIMRSYGLDDAVYSAACELEIPCVELEPPSERWEYKKAYRRLKKRYDSPRSLNGIEDEAFISGDIGRAIQLSRANFDGWREPDLRALRQNITQRNEKMVRRSMPYLLEGCSITTGLTHAIGDNNMLRMYEVRGVDVERI